MTVSMKSTKAQMYSEIERLRDLCDKQEQQLRAANKPAAKPRKGWKRPGGTDYAKFAPDACRYFNKRAVTRDEIYDYINACEVEAAD